MHGDDEEHHGFDAEQLKEHDEHTKVLPPPAQFLSYISGV